MCACMSYFKRQERSITKTMIFSRYNGSKLKEKGSFFLRWRVGDEHERLRIQDHNHGKIQHHHRCESKTRSCVWGCVWGDIYVCIYYDKYDSGSWVEESFIRKVVS